MTEAEQIAWEERAAIMEFMGGLPREEAERRAEKIVTGRAEEPEQLQLAGAEEFERVKRGFRQLFGD